jgi:hypothetical protein
MDFSVVLGRRYGFDGFLGRFGRRYGLDLWACRNARAHNLNNFTSIRGRLRLLKIYLPAGLVLLMNIHQTFLPHHPTLPPRTLAHTPHLLPRSLATLLSDTLAKSTLDFFET